MQETTERPNRLTEALARATMSESELAGKVGVTRQAVNQIARGEKMPSLALAGAIARVLDWSVDALFLGAEFSPVLDHGGEFGAPAAVRAPSRPSTAPDPLESVDNSEPVS